MSGHIIPLDVQIEILKKLAVKPLIKFRAVSKQWKSVIDSPAFITEYRVREDHPPRLLVSYKDHNTQNLKRYAGYFNNDDDDDSNFTQQEFAPCVPNVLTKLFNLLQIVGTSHGLLCLYGVNPSTKTTENNVIIVWNLTIRKSIGITLPGELGWHDNSMVFGFGVCPVTSDPVVVKIINRDGWQAEIFTLSSGIWKRVPSRNLPSRGSIRLTCNQVVIHRFIYFCAFAKIVAMGLYESNNTIVSFNMTTKEFAILDLPDNLAHQSSLTLAVSKIKESLVVLKYDSEDCDVWMMMMERGHTKSFTKLFTINTPIFWVLGFNKNGDPIVETNIDFEYGKRSTLGVYRRSSQHVNNLGTFEGDTFFMGSYMETLILLDRQDCHIY